MKLLKFIIVLIVFAITVLVYVLFDQIEYGIRNKETVTKYEQELHIQREYLNACEARMMYLDSVLERGGIKVIQ